MILIIFPKFRFMSLHVKRIDTKLKYNWNGTWHKI